MFGAMIVFAIILEICCIIYYFVSENSNNKIETSISKDKNEYDKDLAIKIYNKCLVKDIMSLETKKNQDSLEIIAYSYGIRDSEEAKKYFYIGENLFKEKEKEKKKKWNEAKLSEAREEEWKEYEKNKKNADLIGKEKYTYSLKRDLEYGYKALELSQTAERVARTNMGATPRRSDWAIWGGMANGIAGRAAGIATALDIERKNLEEVQNAQNIRESGKKLYQEAKKIQRDLPHALENEELMKKYLEDKLFDDRFPEEKMRNLKISNIEYCITEGRNFNIKAKYTNNKNITLVDSPAILDGSLKVEIYDIEDCLVASGYYVAPGIEKFDLNYKGEDSFDLNYSGFEKKGEINCVCISDNYEEIDEDIEYRVEIKPNHLWFIEK